jgi:hypothetical protein
MNKIQFYVPDKSVYDYYFDKIPKGSRYINFIKKSEDGKYTKEVEELMKKYNISSREAKLIRIFIKRLKK